MLLIDGDARFTIDSFSLNGDLQPDFFAGDTIDHLNQLGLWFRVPGATKEQRLLPSGAITHSSNFVTLLYDESPIFTGEIDVVLIDSPVVGTALVAFDARYTNKTISTLDLMIIVYVDWDVEQLADGDTGLLIQPDNLCFQSGETGDNAVGYSALAATAYEVSPFPALVTSLDDDNITTLANTGVNFGPANLAAGYRLDFQIAPGSTKGNPGFISVRQGDCIPDDCPTIAKNVCCRRTDTGDPNVCDISDSWQATFAKPSQTGALSGFDLYRLGAANLSAPIIKGAGISCLVSDVATSEAQGAFITVNEKDDGLAASQPSVGEVHYYLVTHSRTTGGGVLPAGRARPVAGQGFAPRFMNPPCP